MIYSFLLVSLFEDHAKIIILLILSYLFSLTAAATEIYLPRNQGKISISDRVVRVLGKNNIEDGEYQVTVDDRDITLLFIEGKGSIID